MPPDPRKTLLSRTLTRPLRAFAEIEASGGILLLAATVVALVWASSPWRHGYHTLWALRLDVSYGPVQLHQSLGSFVGDGLMAVFFFVIGAELRREWVSGALRDRRAALLPGVAALGGMVAPALLYVAFTAGGAGGHGWGIPMATDVAFALAVVAALGRRVPHALKVFLVTLAIVDDIGSIVVIAVFYGSPLSWSWLAAALGLLVAVALVGRRDRSRWKLVLTVLALLVWYATLRSGVNATIAGVALGVVLGGSEEPGGAEVRLHPWSSFVIVPVFALANAGVTLGDGLGGDGFAVGLGVFVGLVVGKAVGVTGASWLLVRSGWARLPAGVRWTQLLGVATLAGIGFTVSLFVTGLAFAPGSRGVHLAAHAKVGILAASVVAALAGSAILAVAATRTGGARGGRP